MMTINGSRAAAAAAAVVRFQLYGPGAARGGLPYTPYIYHPKGFRIHAFFFFFFLFSHYIMCALA